MGVVLVRLLDMSSLGRDRVLVRGWSEGLQVVSLNELTILISRENGVSEITKLRLDCFTCFRIWSQMSCTMMTTILIVLSEIKLLFFSGINNLSVCLLRLVVHTLCLAQYVYTCTFKG